MFAPIKSSPVYSMDVHSEAVWLVTGVQNGSINLWTVRHEEGMIHHVLKNHKSPVSVLRITPDERGLISGSWDKSLNFWDLDKGSIVRSYPLSSQITSASFQTKNTSSPLLVSSFDGAIHILDHRSSNAETRKYPSGTPPWALSASWGANGKSLFVGRRNGTVDELDLVAGKISRTIKMPRDSGPVSSVCALPSGRHLICASFDNIRLYDLDLYSESTQTQKIDSHLLANVDIGASNTPFTIIPGHHGGVISNLHIDEAARYLVSISGNRGWDGVSTERCLFYTIETINSPVS
ncbi:Transcription factor spt8 [Nowakowskiella sp. JEL0407]|nr:Transcription factor spt8 [Nowakowskiella sp. JEL0407]